MRQIVIVDDDPDYTSLLERAFKDVGFKGTLKIIHDGKDLLGYLNVNDRPILVLLDINMPGCSGLDLLKIVKGIDHLRAIPVVMLSASEYTEDIKESYGYGANAYMVKPLIYQELQQIIGLLNQYWTGVSRTAAGHWSDSSHY